MTSSYILKDRSLDYQPSLTVIPEVHEDLPTLPDQSKTCSKFSTKIEFIKPKQRTSEESPTSVKSHSSEASSSPERFKSPVKEVQILKDRFLIHKELKKKSLEKARLEIDFLRKNKEKLQEKVLLLTQSLGRIEESKQEAETIKSIEFKLEKLELQQLAPEQDSRLPEAILKVKHLESEIKKLKSLKDSSIFGYEEELKTINLKLKDLQECNEILTEILACFRREPLLLENSPGQGKGSPLEVKDLYSDRKNFDGDFKGVNLDDKKLNYDGKKNYFEGDSPRFDVKNSPSDKKSSPVNLKNSPVSIRNSPLKLENEQKRMIGTIKLEQLIDKDNALEEIYTRRDQLMKSKEILEAEYREIPNNSKSLTSKKRKLSLEYQLSLNYSQLVSVNNKIKKLSSDRN
jgi:hypothetical protein